MAKLWEYEITEKEQPKKKKPVYATEPIVKKSEPITRPVQPVATPIAPTQVYTPQVSSQFNTAGKSLFQSAPTPLQTTPVSTTPQFIDTKNLMPETGNVPAFVKPPVKPLTKEDKIQATINKILRQEDVPYNDMIDVKNAVMRDPKYIKQKTRVLPMIQNFLKEKNLSLTQKDVEQEKITSKYITPEQKQTIIADPRIGQALASVEVRRIALSENLGRMANAQKSVSNLPKTITVDGKEYPIDVNAFMGQIQDDEKAKQARRYLKTTALHTNPFTGKPIQSEIGANLKLGVGATLLAPIVNNAENVVYMLPPETRKSIQNGIYNDYVDIAEVASGQAPASAETSNVVSMFALSGGASAVLRSTKLFQALGDVSKGLKLFGRVIPAPQVAEALENGIIGSAFTTGQTMTQLQKEGMSYDEALGKSLSAGLQSFGANAVGGYLLKTNPTVKAQLQNGLTQSAVAYTDAKIQGMEDKDAMKMAYLGFFMGVSHAGVSKVAEVFDKVSIANVAKNAVKSIKENIVGTTPTVEDIQNINPAKTPKRVVDNGFTGDVTPPVEQVQQAQPEVAPEVTPIQEQVQPEVAQPVKQPWEMTQQEWLSGGNFSKGTKPLYDALGGRYQKLDDSYKSLFDERENINELIKNQPDKKYNEYIYKNGKWERITSFGAGGKQPKIVYASNKLSELLTKRFELENKINEIRLDRDKKLNIQAHELAIKQALSEGKPVPPEVLAEYPDLTQPVSEVIPEQVVAPVEQPRKDITKEVIGGVGGEIAKIQSRQAMIDNYQKMMEKYDINPSEKLKSKIIKIEKDLGYTQSYFDLKQDTPESPVITPESPVSVKSAEDSGIPVETKQPWEMTEQEWASNQTLNNLENTNTQKAKADVLLFIKNKNKPLKNMSADDLQNIMNDMYIESLETGTYNTSYENIVNDTQKLFNDLAESYHQLSIENALKEGKSVPPEVLAEYLDLQSKPEIKTETAPLKQGDAVTTTKNYVMPDGKKVVTSVQPEYSVGDVIYSTQGDYEPYIIRSVQNGYMGHKGKFYKLTRYDRPATNPKDYDRAFDQEIMDDMAKSFNLENIKKYSYVKSYPLEYGVKVGDAVTVNGKSGVIVGETAKKYKVAFDDGTSPNGKLVDKANVVKSEKTVSNKFSINSRGNAISSDLNHINNFNKWFENSKVVDEQGNPKVMLHGGNDVNILEGGKGIRSGLHSQGIWFTGNKDYAKDFATGKNQKIHEVYLDIKNPADIYNSTAHINTVDELKKQGYDGAYDHETGFWVAFDSNQIKSINNSGRFDKNNPDMYDKDSSVDTTKPATETELQSPTETVVAPEVRENVTPTELDARTKNKELTLYRGEQGILPSGVNLGRVQSFYDIIGKPKNNAKNLAELTYYSESFDVAKEYANRDESLLNEIKKKTGVFNGRENKYYTEQDYIDIFKTLYGHEPRPNGKVIKSKINIKNPLDITSLGETTTYNEIMKLLLKLEGETIPIVKDRNSSEWNKFDEIDERFGISKLFGDNDEISTFMLLKNEPNGFNRADEFVKYMKEKGYDAVRFAEDGTNHYAVINNSDANKLDELDARTKKAPLPPLVTPSPLRDGKPIKRIQQMISDFEKATGIVLVPRKKLSGGAGGRYKPSSGGIAVTKQKDLGLVMHEVAHRLDDENKVFAEWVGSSTSPYDAELSKFWDYGSTTKTGPRSSIEYKRHEGLAEYFKAYMKNPDATIAMAPKLHEYLKKQIPAKTWKAIDNFTSDVRRYVGSGRMTDLNWQAEEAQSIGDKIKATFEVDKFVTLTPYDMYKYQFEDQLAPLWAAVRKTPGFDEKMLPENNPYLLGRLLAGHDTVVIDMIKNGVRDFKGNKIKGLEEGIEGFYKRLKTENLSEEEVNAKMEDAKKFLLSERVMELAERFKRETGLTGAGGGVVTDLSIAKNDYDEIMAKGKDYVNDIMEFVQYYRKWADANLRYLVDSGVMPESVYNDIKENNKYYAAMNRVMDGEVYQKGGATTSFKVDGDIIKKAQGSERDIIDPVLSLFRTTDRVVREGQLNRFWNVWTKMIESSRQMYEGGVPETYRVMEDVTSANGGKPPDTKHVVKVFKNGEAHYYRINPEVFKSITSISNTDDLFAMNQMQTTSGKILELLNTAAKAPAKILRATVIYSPAFMVKNLFRDMMERVYQSDIKANVLESLPQAPTKDLVSDLYAGGGGQAGNYMIDEATFINESKKIARKLSKDGKSFVGRYEDLVDAYTNLADMSELAGRVSEYKKAYKYAKEELGYDDYNAQLYGSFKARDVLDYARVGTFIKKIAPYVAFLNPGIQGLAKTRDFAMKNPKLYLSRIAMFGISMELYAMLAAHQFGYEEEYRNLPSQQKDFFHNFKVGDNFWLRIPKGYVGAVMSSAARRMIDYAIGNPKAFENYEKSLAAASSPIDWDLTNILGGLKTIVELQTNTNLYTEQPIVSPYEINKSIKYREGAKYASNIAKKLYEAFPATKDPRYIDHVIETQFGNWGKNIIRLTATGTRKATTADYANMLTGLVAQSPGYSAPDIQYVEKTFPLVNWSPNSIKLRQYMAAKKAFYEAQTAKGKDDASKHWRAVAKELRVKLEKEKKELNTKDYPWRNEK